MADLNFQPGDWSAAEVPAAAMDIPSMITRIAQEHGVNPMLALRVAQRESGLNPNVRDGAAGEKGLFQVKPSTGRDMGVTDLSDPVQNTIAGIRYLAMNLKTFGGDEFKAAQAYNAGPGAVASGKVPGSANEYAESVAGANRGAQIVAERRSREGEFVPGAWGGAFEEIATAQPKPAEKGALSRGFSGGLTGGVPKMAGGALQGAGTIVGSDILKQWGQKLSKAGDENAAQYGSPVPSIANVRTDSVTNTLKDFFGEYLPYQAGNAVASMLPTIVSGIAGTIAGGAVAGPPGAAVGGMAGIVLSGYPMNYGDIYSDALDDKGIQQAIKDGKLTDRSVASITALAAVPITALDSWSIGGLGRALTSDVKKAIYKRVFSEMVAGGLREGTTEGLQQIVSEVVQQQLGSDKTAMQSAIAVVDNAIGGMAGGAIMGGGAGAIQRGPAAPATQAAPTPTEAPAEAAAPPAEAEDTFAIPARLVTPAQFLGGPEGPPGQPVAPEGLPLQYPGAPAYTPAAEPLGTQAPEGPALTPIDQARQDAQILKSGGTLPLTADDQRVRNATLVAVYGENAAVQHVIAGGPQFSRIGDAMVLAAPTVERVRGVIGEAGRSRDFTDEITAAVDEIAQIRKSGLSVAQVMAEGIHHDLSTEAQELAAFLDENSQNPQRMAAFMENYLHEVEKFGGAPSVMRGRQFENFERAAAERKAAQEEKVIAEKAKTEKKAKATRLYTAVEGARVAKFEQTLAKAKAAGSGIQPEHKTAIELAFENAKKLKEKPRAKPSPETRPGVPASAPSRPEAGAGQAEKPAGPAQGAVPQPAQAADQGNTRPGGEAGNRGGPAENEVLSPVDQAAHEAATSPLNEKPAPTGPQIEAGNYEKGHANVGGLDISIENPAGSTRRPEWPTLESHYGYVKGVPARSPDKEHVDVFVKPGTSEKYNGPVFVIDQMHDDGSYNEPKAMIGYRSQREARATYLRNYTKGWESHIGGITEMTMGQFKSRLQDENAFMQPQERPLGVNQIPHDLVITLPVDIEETGTTVYADQNARKAYTEVTQRINRLEALLGCLTR
jgi:hypothetical protein